jgi:hypothetical protein
MHPGLLNAILLWQTVQFPVHQQELIRGAALTSAGTALFTWGSRVISWTLPEGRPQVLSEKSATYGEGGCPFDVNRDGEEDLVLLEEPGRMVWLEAPGWKAREIDTGADFQDCLPATLHGRLGVLVIHRRMQIRFYMVPKNVRTKWPYREIYSIYTPSHQGDLLLADVNKDGFDDILCGNYWIRSPGSFDFPWRLFAINLWFEEEKSSMSRLELAPISGNDFPDLIVSQREMEAARLAWFSRPGDPTALWEEHRLEGKLALRFPKALAAGDLDADGRPEIVAGEMAGGDSRLIMFRNDGNGRFAPSVLALTQGLFRAWIRDLDGDGRKDILAVGPRSIAWWRMGGVR